MTVPFIIGGIGVLSIAIILGRNWYLRKTRKISDIDIQDFNREIAQDLQDLKNTANSGAYMSQIHFDDYKNEYDLTDKEIQELKNDMRNL
jgi:hypothetical protein